MISRLFGKNKAGFCENSRLISFRYSPGYSDMRGAMHSEELTRNENGGWITVCRDRDSHAEQVVVTVYSVSDAAAEDFTSFLRKSGAASLADRRKDDLFATDYSPWEYEMEFDPPRSGSGRRYIRICEYRKYSKRDYALIRELNSRFRAIRGEKISETVEPD
jgi:hypothetical protein